MSQMLGTLLLILALFGPGHAQADTAQVDLELVLMADVSRSMTPAELEIQRRGYAEALVSEDVYQAILTGPLQTIALTYVEWAGGQQTIVPWRLIATPKDLADFAADLTVRFDPGMRRTSISGALDFGAYTLENNAFDGFRRVIDISGDGPNNLGPLVTRARDQVVAKGIVINGLPLMTRDGTLTMFHLDHLDIYYQTCVIGGTGAFVIPVYDWPDFADAVRRKLVLEIAGLMPPLRVLPAQASDRDPTDCRIGEKIWEEFRGSGFFIP